MHKITQQEKGSLSITALWMLALLTLAGVTLAEKVVTTVRQDSYRWRVIQAQWLARAGVMQAMQILQIDASTQDSLPPYDALNEPWAFQPAAFQKVPCGNGYFEVGYLDNAVPGDRNLVYGIYDENRKPNLNKLPGDLLARLPGMTPDKVDALLDWIDSDELPRKAGAESEYYQSLKQPYSCKNDVLTYLDEIRLIRGFQEQDVQRLAPLVTLFGDGTVNINTATKTSLHLLGLPKETAAKIIALRNGPDGIPFTDDDIVFRNPTQILPMLQKRITISQEDQIVIKGLISAGFLGVHSSYFRIESTGVIPGKEMIRKTIIAIVYRKNRNELKVVRWIE